MADLPTIVVPANPNLVSDIQRGRANYTQFLLALGVRGSIKRPQKDADGISAGQPGATDILYTNVPFSSYPFAGTSPPVVNSNLRRSDVFVRGGCAISLPFGTDIQAGDQLEVEPVGTGLSIYIIDSVSLGNDTEFDTIAYGADSTIIR